MSEARHLGVHPPPGDSKRTLLEAATAAVEATKGGPKTAAPIQRKWPRVWYLTSTTVLSLFGLWMLLAKPAWFLTPPPPPEPVHLQDASARLGLVREIQRVESFRQANGRLPASLLEAGTSARGVTYTRLGTSDYMISLTIDTGTVTYRSGTPIDVFLGTSLKTISERSTP